MKKKLFTLSTILFAVSILLFGTIASSKEDKPDYGAAACFFDGHSHCQTCDGFYSYFEPASIGVPCR